MTLREPVQRVEELLREPTKKAFNRFRSHQGERDNQEYYSDDRDGYGEYSTNGG